MAKWQTILTNLDKDSDALELLQSDESFKGLFWIEDAFSLSGEPLPNMVSIHCEIENRLKVLNKLSPKTFPLNLLD